MGYEFFQAFQGMLPSFLQSDFTLSSRQDLIRGVRIEDNRMCIFKKTITTVFLSVPIFNKCNFKEWSCFLVKVVLFFQSCEWSFLKGSCDCLESMYYIVPLIFSIEDVPLMILCPGVIFRIHFLNVMISHFLFNSYTDIVLSRDKKIP